MTYHMMSVWWIMLLWQSLPKLLLNSTYLTSAAQLLYQYQYRQIQLNFFMLANLPLQRLTIFHILSARLFTSVHHYLQLTGAQVQQVLLMYQMESGYQTQIQTCSPQCKIIRLHTQQATIRLKSRVNMQAMHYQKSAIHSL